MLIGEGKTSNYLGLLLFPAGAAASGVAVYYTQVGGRRLVPTVLSILLMFAGRASPRPKRTKGKRRLT